MSNIKIAFITSNDAKNRRSYSGTHYYMGQALLRNGFDVTFIGPLKPRGEIIFKTISKLIELVFNKKIRYLHTPYLAKRFARMAEQKMKGKEFDFVFAPAASKEIAYLKKTVPVIYTSDATWKLISTMNPKWSNVIALSKRQSDALEKRAVHNADILTFPTQWVTNSVIKDYGGDASKVTIIPWGANMDSIPGREIALARQRSSQCRLFFLGVHWHRKGGEIAFETLLELEKLGINTHLTVCGCVPPANRNHSKMTVIPFLNKQDETQRKQLEELYLTSDFFLLPTRSECYGIVFCESAAYGLPVITTNIGGVAGVVADGVNGYLLPMEARGAEYAAIIKELYSDENRYNAMVKASRNRFEETLNWDTWAKQFQLIIRKKM